METSNRIEVYHPLCVDATTSLARASDRSSAQSVRDRSSGLHPHHRSVALILGSVAFGRQIAEQTPTAAQRAAAQATLCDRYGLAARSVQIGTKSPDNVALARISLTNGAVMLEAAAADPALDASARDAAHELALGYQDLTAMGTNGVVEQTQFQDAMNAVNNRDRAQKELCGN